MEISKKYEILDEKINSELFKKNVLLPTEDKILERGNLTGIIGSETEITLSVSRDEDEIYTNIDLQSEDELLLSADELDEIGDFIADKLSAKVKAVIKQSGLNVNDISIMGTVTINGERPVVD